MSAPPHLLHLSTSRGSRGEQLGSLATAHKWCHAAMWVQFSAHGHTLATKLLVVVVGWHISECEGVTFAGGVTSVGDTPDFLGGDAQGDGATKREACVLLHMQSTVK